MSFLFVSSSHLELLVHKVKYFWATTTSDLENNSDAHEDYRENYGVELPTGESTFPQREWD